MHRFGTIALISVISASIAVAATLNGISVNTANNRLVDQWNREVYFHGANVVVKSFPWIPETEHWNVDTSFTEKDMQTLQDLGMNGIRLGTMWPGVEPTRGNYNTTYLDALHKLVTKAREYGIHSLLDMHQDVMSEKFCGEGFPAWAVQPENQSSFPLPFKQPYAINPQTGVPSPQDCQSDFWGDYYGTFATGSAFGRFYTNHNGTQDAWVKFWAEVAKKFATSGDAVLGYELINEPWAGNEWKNIVDMVPSVTDHKYLQPMYDKAADAIHTVDTDHAIFFEGVTWDWFWSGFTEVPGGSEWQNKSVLSYHFYIPPDFSPKIQFDARSGDIKRLKCGGMLTEFAIRPCSGCGWVHPHTVMDEAEEHFQSWLFWEYKPFVGARTGYASIWFPNGTIDTGVAFNITRTYAQAVGGETVVSKWKRSDSSFHMTYRTTGSCSKPVTEIFVSSKYHYPNGYNLAINATNNVSVHSDILVNRTASNRLTLTTTMAVPTGTEISVAITKK